MLARIRILRHNVSFGYYKASKRAKKRLGFLIVRMNLWLLTNGLLKQLDLSGNSIFVRYIPGLMGWNEPISLRYIAALDLEDSYEVAKIQAFLNKHFANNNTWAN